MSYPRLACPTCQSMLVKHARKGPYRELWCANGHNHYTRKAVFVSQVEFSIYADLRVKKKPGPRPKIQKVGLRFAPLMRIPTSVPVSPQESTALDEKQVLLLEAEIVEHKRKYKKTEPKKSDALPLQVAAKAVAQKTHQVTEIGPGHRKYIMR
jgi:hypothetical protein